MISIREILKETEADGVLGGSKLHVLVVCSLLGADMLANAAVTAWWELDTTSDLNSPPLAPTGREGGDNKDSKSDGKEAKGDSKEAKKAAVHLKITLTRDEAKREWRFAVQRCVSCVCACLLSARQGGR